MGSASQIMAARSALEHHLKYNVEGCRVRVKVNALGREGINVAECTRTIESQRVNEVTIESLVDGCGCSLEK